MLDIVIPLHLLFTIFGDGVAKYTKSEFQENGKLKKSNIDKKLSSGKVFKLIVHIQ